MTMWEIAKQTLALLGCAEMEMLPEHEQALIAECCYHRVPARAITDMIWALRRDRGGVAVAPIPNTVAIAIPLEVVSDSHAGLGGIAARLAARRLALEEEERGSEGRALAPAA